MKPGRLNLARKPPVGKFDAKVFEAYRDWLVGQGYMPQTVVNAIIGARTMLRWAAGSDLVHDAPKPPKLTVPPRVNTPVFVEDFEQVIELATDPLRTFLELLWEAGLR